MASGHSSVEEQFIIDNYSEGQKSFLTSSQAWLF